MSLSQLDQAMATLRMGLAEIQNREQHLDDMIAQFRTQVRRLPRQALYGQTSLDFLLGAMGEIEERLADAKTTRRRLLAIKKTAMEELEALRLVKQVDEARRALAELRRRNLASGGGGEAAAEVRRLERFIAEHSKLAEWAITASYQERHQGG